jgi:tRNA dimethylallyltransferase
MKNKTCIVIVGPTAVGKTAIAVELAQHFSTQIISADSRQCFKELGIGVAKPSDEELQAVHHYFINSHSIQDEMNAAVFEQYALEKVNNIFTANDFAVMVGGTGLYVKAFCDGIDIIPAIDKDIREKIIAAYETNGIAWLQNEVAINDPLYFSKGEIKNPQRLMRALEVKLATGKSVLEFQTNEKRERGFDVIKIGLELPRERLYQNINNRVDAMAEAGLVKEAEGLYPFKQLNALQTVGYKELFEYFDGTVDLGKAIDKIKLNTRHYAKRQMTWFKKDESIKWSTVDISSVKNLLHK